MVQKESRCHAGAQIASLVGLQIVDSCSRRRIKSSLLTKCPSGGILWASGSGG